MKTVIENRKLFLGALRSGEYNQIRINARRSDGFCALGVFFDSIGCEWQLARESQSYYWPNGNSHYSEMAQELLGEKYSTICQIMSNNDKGWTFLEIADWLEEEWGLRPEEVQNKEQEIMELV